MQYSPLLPPVGVWAVSQSQCGRPPSQAGYPSTLGRPLPHQQADRPRAHPVPQKLSTTDTKRWSYPVLDQFPRLIPKYRADHPRVTHPFATRVPLQAVAFPFDLHVLSTPPAFVLSQDQTLHKRKNSIRKNPQARKPEKPDKQKLAKQPHQSYPHTGVHEQETNVVKHS